VKREKKEKGEGSRTPSILVICKKEAREQKKTGLPVSNIWRGESPSSTEGLRGDLIQERGRGVRSIESQGEKNRIH